MYYDICILSCLMEKPRHGYEIKKYLISKFEVCTKINNNTIYPMLKKYMKIEAITQKEQLQQGKPAKKVYYITEKGRLLFFQRLNNISLDVIINRDEYMMRLSFFNYLINKNRKRLLNERAEYIRQTIKKVHALGKSDASNHVELRQFYLDLLNLDQKVNEDFYKKIDLPCEIPTEYLSSIE